MEHLKPTLKARQLLTVCLFLMEFVNASHLASHTRHHSNQNLPKSMSLPTLTDGRKKKYYSSTMAIRNAGESADIKVNTLNKLTAKRKV